MSKAYLFSGDEYVRYGIRTKAIDRPMDTIHGRWSGFPTSWTSVDAAVNYGNGKIYFFRGTRYLRFDILTDRIDQEERGLHDFWHGLPSWTRIDAAYNCGEGSVCFKSGDESVGYDVRSDQALVINIMLPPTPSDWKKVDAAIDGGDGTVDFLRKDRCARYDLLRKGWLFQDEPLAAHWKGLPSHWKKVDAALTIDLAAERMGAALEKDLGPKTVGFSYAIHRGGRQMKAGAAGLRIKAIDNDGCSKAFGVRTAMGIVSITKSLTAMAATKRIAQRKDVSLDSSIGKHLPDAWSPSAEVSAITFKQLLRHESGLYDSPTSTESIETFDDIRERLEGGVMPQTYEYRNINFCLFRILLPALYGLSPFDAQIAAMYYKLLMRTHVFEPSAVFDADCRVDHRDYPFVYGTKSPSAAGTDWYGKNNGDDTTMISGAGGWKLNVVELGRVISTWAATDRIMPAHARKAMLDNSLGGSGNAKQGITFGHNGSAGNEHGYYNRYYWFDDDVIITVLNNMLGAPVDQAIRDAHAKG